MSTMDIFPSQSLDLIAHHEGFSATPYRDTQGHLTILYGHDQDASPLCSEAVALLQSGEATRAGVVQLRQDALQALTQVEQFAVYPLLNPPRQAVLLDMCYNMGVETLKTFTNFLSYLEQERYEEAAADMLKTLWASQVGVRAVEDASIIKSGIMLPNLHSVG